MSYLSASVAPKIAAACACAAITFAWLNGIADLARPAAEQAAAIVAASSTPAAPEASTAAVHVALATPAHAAAK